MVRNYLQQMDRAGLTINHGRRGRQITPKGEEELKSSFVIDKVGFVASRIDNLTYQMNFSLRKQKGKIILNVSTIDKKDLKEAIHHMELVFRADLGMGRYVAPSPFPSDKATIVADDNRVAIGTVCSVTINGILLGEGIHTTSRFGGLLELVNGEPSRFTEIINYDGSSIDPLEIFIKGGMTSVGQAVSTGSGRIGASFREVPSVALPRVEKIRKKLEGIGLGGILMIGKPNRPLLDIPVSEGRAGIIVAGGEFRPDAVEAVADIASLVNQRTENIGARRLYTIMERLLEDISFEAPARRGAEIVIDAEYVQQRLAGVLTDEDLSRYIL